MFYVRWREAQEILVTQTQHRKRKAKLYTHCVACKKLKAIPTTRYISKLEYQRDPYCSRSCCESAQAA